MRHQAYSTPPENIHVSNDVARHLPDHAYSSLFTTGILNSSHSYGYDHGRFPPHLTFHQQTHQTPRKNTPTKSGLPSPLSSSSASPSMKKKQSSVSLARSLNSSQSGSIRTPSKLAATEKGSRSSSKPKIEWWRGRASSYVANKEGTSEEKPPSGKGAWLRQSDVWMAPEVFAVEGNTIPRNDSSLALAPSRPLPGLPFAKDNVGHRSDEAPVIKKKASFGPFKFKNFFQSSKGKDAGGSGNGISKYREQLAVLAPSKRVNQPSQLHSGTGSLPNRYDQRAPYQSHSQSLPRPAPRPPPICTSFPRGNGFSSPYAPTSTCDSSPNILPYMAGAGDGWDTPFLPYPPAAPRSRHTNHNTEFPFPVVSAHQVEDDPMEQLVVQDDNARRGRVTSAAFEYQEFETDVRNSGQLDSSVSSNEYKEGTVTDDLARSTNSHTQSLRKSPLEVNAETTRPTNSQCESLALPLSPPPQNRQLTPRAPVVETVKPLSIGRNYPRSRSTAFVDVYSTSDTVRSMQPQAWDTPRYVYSDTAEHTLVEEGIKENRPTWDVSRQFSDLALDDTDTRGYDSPQW